MMAANTTQSPGASEEAVQALLQRLGPDRVRHDVGLAPYTTFRIGGPADLFYEARSAEELATAVSSARELGIPLFLLGLGANILVGDGGWRGLVIRNAAARIRVDRDSAQLWAESGAVIHPDVIQVAVENGLSGLEHYAGIPSTVGGALWQNLHFLSPAPQRERTVFISEVLTHADLLTAEGSRRRMDSDYFGFGYDYSILHERDDVVLAATFQLSPAPPERLRRVIRENLAWRSERHPPLETEPSAGSIFKKISGVGAGRLIDECGLKGFRIGGAQVTQRHANIVINVAQATAADVRRLIGHIQAVVLERTGCRLEPEIMFVGEFSDSANRNGGGIESPLR